MTDRGVGRRPPQPRLRVLFVCTGNSARSQMAEALLTARAGDRFIATSAGTKPAGVNPLTVAALAEIGIDASAATSKSVDGFVGADFDFVITVCDDAREACPYMPGARRTVHWSLPDPASATGSPDERMAAFRAVRAEIEGRIEAFAGAVGAAPTAAAPA